MKECLPQTLKMPNDIEYRKILTELITKQMVVLGPTISLLKARKVSSLVIDDDGHVVRINGSPEEALKSLINEYVSLSGEIIKKTMEPLLARYPSLLELGKQMVKESEGNF